MKPAKGRIIGVGSRLENFQTGLDLFGMTEIPVASQAADVASGVISLATGDYVGAALSFGGLIPGIGQATGTSKIARRAKKIADVATNEKRTATLSRFGDLTVGNRITSRNSTKIAKHSEVDAKIVKTETPKELLTNTKEQVGKKLDISDGLTNNVDKEKWHEYLGSLNNGTSRNVQTNNHNNFINSLENGKVMYNPTGTMPKSTIFKK